jgi:hypothetical protein
MLTPQKVLDNYYLDTRCQLIEIASMLDRYDRAAQREGSSDQDDRMDQIYQALTLLAQRESGPNRGEQLLNLFSDLS